MSTGNFWKIPANHHLASLSQNGTKQTSCGKLQKCQHPGYFKNAIAPIHIMLLVLENAVSAAFCTTIFQILIDLSQKMLRICARLLFDQKKRLVLCIICPNCYEHYFDPLLLTTCTINVHVYWELFFNRTFMHF